MLLQAIYACKSLMQPSNTRIYNGKKRFAAGYVVTIVICHFQILINIIPNRSFEKFHIMAWYGYFKTHNITSLLPTILYPQDDTSLQGLHTLQFGEGCLSPVAFVYIYVEP